MTSAPVTSAAIIDGIDVDALAAAVTACPGVAGMFGGPGAAVGSYLPGRRVAGVEVNAERVTLTVRSRWGVTAAALLGQVRTAVTPLLHHRPFQVVVADIDDPTVQPALLAAPVQPALPAAPVHPDAEGHAAAAGVTVPVSPGSLRRPGSAPPPTPAATL